MNKLLVWVGIPMGMGILLLALVVVGSDSGAGGGLKIEDVKIGEGPPAKKGDQVTVHYIGKLKNGTVFDTSQKEPQGFTFVLGKGQVIKGWDEGLVGMKEGGYRKLIIPPEMGYGAKGSGKAIPPNAELHFDIQLIQIN